MNDVEKFKIYKEKYTGKYYSSDNCLFFLGHNTYLNNANIKYFMNIINLKELTIKYSLDIADNIDTYINDIKNGIYKEITADYFHNIRLSTEVLIDSKNSISKCIQDNFNNICAPNMFEYDNYYKLEFQWSSGYDTCVIKIKNKFDNMYVNYIEYSLNQLEGGTVVNIDKFEGKTLIAELNKKIEKADSIKEINEIQFNKIKKLYLDKKHAIDMCAEEIRSL